MKKLMVMIGAAAAAFGLLATNAFADEPEEFGSATSIESDEGYSAGTLDPETDSYWFSTASGDEIGATVKAYGSETPPTHTEYFQGDQLQYLALEADTTLYRTAGEVDSTLVTPAMTPVDITSAARDGIEFDQLVKFSAYDADTTTVELEAGAKFAVWLKTTYEDENDPTRNTYALMVTFGQLNDLYAPTETRTVQLAAPSTAIQPDTWRRLTVTAINAIDMGNDGFVPGFTVAIDGTVLAAATATDMFPSDASILATAEAKVLIAANKLFPSAVKYDATGATQLCGIGFKGTGSLDDIAVCEHPLFQKDITITAPDHTKVVRVEQNGVQILPNDQGKYVITPGTVSVWIARDGNWILSKTDWVFENVNGDIAASQFTGIEVVAALAQILKNDGATTNLYASLAAAVTAATADDTVTVLADTTLTSTLEINKTTAINLAGKTITLGDDLTKGFNTADNSGTLTISNGTIAVTGTRGNVAYSRAIMLNKTNGVFKDLTLNVPGFEYVLDQESNLGDVGKTQGHYWSDTPAWTLDCDNVAITGNGSLYHIENAVATLNNCSAAKATGTTCFGNFHDAAIYFSCGSKVTVTGGNFNYDVALQTGYLGGDIDVKSGTFAGTIQSLMRDDMCVFTGNNAKISISGGSFTGNFHTEAGEHTVNPMVWDVKGGSFSVDPTAYLADGYYAKANGTNPETWTVAAKTGFMVIIAEKETYFDSFADAINAASANDTIYILENASIAADAVTKAITVNIAAEKTLTVTGEAALGNALKVAGTGAIARTSALDVAAALNLAELAYAQTAGCTGGFNIKNGGIVYMPIGATFPDATLAVNTAASVDGAQIVVGGVSGTTYTWGNSVWAQGTVIAVAKVGTTGYGTLQAAFAAATAGQTVTILKDLTVEATDVAAIAADITIDANGKVVTLANAAMTLTNNLTVVCTGTKTEKGLLNKAQITIAAGKTLDLSALNWAEGLIGETPTTAKFYLGDGAIYTQGKTIWDDSLTNIFFTVNASKKIKLDTTGSYAMITTEDAGPAPVDPSAGGKVVTDVDETTANAKVAEINTPEGRQAAVKVPDAFSEMSAADQTAYKSYFDAVKVAKGGDKYDVELQVNLAGTNAVNTANTTTFTTKVTPAQLAALTEDTAKEVAAVPGFYYWVESSGADVGMATKDVSAPATATGATVDLTFKAYDTGKGFYKIIASPTPQPAK